LRTASPLSQSSMQRMTAIIKALTTERKNATPIASGYAVRNQWIL
jgi:hypothetical protein